MISAKLYLVNASLFTMLCFDAQAATTAISGTLDAYLERTSRPRGAAVQLESSGLGVSRLAVKSTEELDGDMTVTAYLEGGIRVDTGSNGSQSGPIFNRMSYVSLRKRGAKLTIGKQYSPHLLLLAGEFDIYATSFWATPYTIFQGAGRYMLVPDAVSFQVAVPAQEKSLTLSAMWARRDDERFDKPPGSQLFVSALYEITKTLRVGAGAVIDHHFSYSSPDARLLLIGLNYDTGTIRVSGAIQTIDFKTGSGRVNEYCLGAGYWLNAHNLIQLNYGRTYEPGAPQKYSAVYGVSLVHDLSKKTALYAAAGHLSNGRDYKNAFDMPVPAGVATDNVMLGIRRYF